MFKVALIKTKRNAFPTSILNFKLKKKKKFEFFILKFFISSRINCLKLSLSISEIKSFIVIFFSNPLLKHFYRKQIYMI